MIQHNFTHTSVNRFLPLFVLLCLLSCKKEQKENTVPLRPVRYERIGFGDNTRINIYTGTARSDKEINLSFRTTGILTMLNIRNGQIVKKGDLLARLDNTEAQLALEQAKSTKNSASATLATAKSSLSRTRTLYEKGSSSLSDYENAKSSYASAKANYESASKSVDIQRKQVSYGTIVAPRNGVIANKSVEINENVTAGQSIAILNAGKNMEVSLGLPENMINLVSLNMKVKATFSSLDDKVFNGYIKELSPSLNTETSTFPIRIALTGDTRLIRSGMTASVTFVLKPRNSKDRIVAPVSAVGEDSKGNFVFLITPTANNTATVKKHHIEIGELWYDGFEVKKGLSIGDRVATAGLQTLLDGQKVRLQKEKSQSNN